jgi:hypothetical protein
MVDITVWVGLKIVVYVGHIEVRDELELDDVVGLDSGTGGFRSAKDETVGRISVPPGSPRSRKRIVISGPNPFIFSHVSVMCLQAQKSCDVPFLFARFVYLGLTN